MLRRGVRLLLLAAATLIIASATEAIRSAPAEDALASIDDPQTLSQLLQWSLANQDLNALHQKAEAIRHGDGAVPPATPPGVLSADGNAGELSADGTYSIAGAALLPLGGGTAGASIRPTVQRMTPERLAELKVLQKQLMPDMVGLMREALAIAIDESLPVDEREAALLKLEDHASDIDQAHDLMIIGGLAPVVQLLGSDVPPLQAAAAWVIGSAVQNHRELQLHVLAIPAAMPSLLALARLHASAEVRAKALYALSTLVSNCAEAQAAFFAAGGANALLSILTGARLGRESKIVRKALALVTDLLREMGSAQGGGALGKGEGAGESTALGGGAVLVGAAGGVTQTATAEADAAANANSAAAAAAAEAGAVAPLLDAWRNATELCAAVLHCLESDDLDAQEKALQALEQLVAVALLPVVTSPEASAAVVADEADCTLSAVRAALHRYRDRCDAGAGGAPDAAPDSTEAEGDEDDGSGDGPSACDAAMSLDQQLERMMLRP
eukprot:jgi/Chrpa1/7102/Chrysochromulina_OHIO_Genome00010980-RA